VSKINIHINLGCNISKSTINNNKIKFPEKEKENQEPTFNTDLCQHGCSFELPWVLLLSTSASKR
jgi:hypothetical protein